MANKPDDPRPPRPDDKKAHPDAALPPEGKPAGESDSAIDLGTPGEGELSGISVIEWASLVENPPGETGSSNVKVDSPSDADLHQHLSPPTAAAPPPASEAEADVIMAEMLADSGVNLAQEPVGPSAQVPVVPAGMGEESAIDLGPEVDFEQPAVAAPVGDSAIDLGADAVIVEEDVPVAPVRSDSAIDLGADMVVEENVSAASSSSSAIDLGADAVVVEERIEQPPTGHSAIDLGSEAILVEEPAAPAATASDSGIVLDHGAIVEESAAAPAPRSGDSAIDLGSEAVIVEEPAAPASPAAVSGDSGIVLDQGAIIEESAAAPAPRPGDSAIDLGAEAVIVEEEVPIAPRPGDSAIDLGSDALMFVEDLPQAVQHREDSAIDLGDDVILQESVPAGGKEPAVVDLPADAVEEGIDLPLTTASEPVVELPTGGLEMVGHVDSGIDLEAVTAGEGSGTSLTPGESGIDLIAEDVILEEPAAGQPTSGGSSRDLIAEGLESGVDLLGKKKAPKADSSEDALEDFLAQVGTEDQSSSVDLGSAHTIDVFKDEDISPPAAESGIVLEEPVDLDATTAMGGKPTSAADLDLTDAVEVSGDAVIEEEVLEGAVLEEEEEAPRKGKKKPADEEEVAEAEKGPVKQRGRAGAWMGGTVLGMLLGSAACLGVWLGGIEPPGEWRTKVGEVTGLDVAKKDGDKGKDGGRPTTQPAGFAQVAALVENGDLDKVSETDLAKADENNPKELVKRAEYNWLKYLRSERGKDLKAVLKPDAELVKKALADLDRAVAKNDPDALFLRGQIHEMTGKTKEAIADYTKGLEFKDDAARFQAALDRLRDRGAVARLQPGDERRLLALLLIHLQAPPGGAPAPAAPTEAGYRFWQAIRALREGKYDQAIKVLEEARNFHDQRRFLFPNKPQNPKSDPREEIFLRACDELKAYWTLLARLKGPDYLKLARAERYPDVDKLLEKVEEDTRNGLVKDLGDKLLKDKPVAKSDDIVKLISDERKATKDKETDLQGMLDKQKKEIASLEKKLEDTATLLAKSEKALKETAAREKALLEANAASDAVLTDVADAVNVKFKDVKTSKDMLLKEVREAVRIAKVVDPKGSIRRLEGELAADRARLKERWAPAEMLPVWLAVLESDRARTDLADSALKDVRRVVKDSSSSEAERGRAIAISGLVLRNQEKFAASQAALQRARELLAETRGPWLDRVDAALLEVSNPGRTYARRAAALASRGQSAEALAVLDRGLKVVEEKKGPLYAQRAAIALEQARAKGPLDPADPAAARIRKDAQAAADDGLAEGHYLLGRLAEELGQVNAAATSYRAALKAHGVLDAQGSRYRVALARVLLRSRAGEAVPPRPAPPPERVGKASLQPTEKPRRLAALELLNLLMSLTLQAPGLPLTGPKVREAEKLADEVLAAGDKVPFDVRAQALAIKGLYTRALFTYTDGLRAQGLLAPRYANGLRDLVAGHPQLKRPESLTVPDPAASERHYAAGLNFFASRRWRDAEKEFLSAVENDNGDARYYYYLGLSRLAQGKRDAYEDFDQAARLERSGRPDRASVSSALERVQGPMRRVLNNIRNRPTRERAR